jgi:preprotein translocase subunit SecB
MKTRQSQADVPTMTAKEFNDLLHCLELQEIYLLKANVSASRDTFAGKAILKFNENAKLTDRTDDRARIDVEYLLTGRCGARNVLRIATTFVVNFRLNTQFPEEFFDIYIKSSLPLQTYPYFREFVQSIVARAGLPILVIPLRKFLLPK